MRADVSSISNSLIPKNPIHPSIICNCFIPFMGSRGFLLEPITAISGWGQGTPWTSRNLIAGPSLMAEATMKGANCTSGAIWGSVSYSRTLQHAAQLTNISQYKNENENCKIKLNWIKILIPCLFSLWRLLTAGETPCTGTDKHAMDTKKRRKLEVSTGNERQVCREEQDEVTLVDLWKVSWWCRSDTIIDNHTDSCVLATFANVPTHPAKSPPCWEQSEKCSEHVFTVVSADL